MKKRVSVCMFSAAFLLTGICCGASWGNYPTHVEFSKAPKEIVSETAVGSSPAENVFYVEKDGNKKGFVLLDKDEDGNFFLITEEEYGTYWFSAKTGEDINVGTVADSEWNFDPKNQTSVAYWLENDFWNNGNKGMKLPENIKENILTHEWEIENNFTQMQVTKSKVGDDAYEEYESWLEMKDGLRKVESKLSFISYTEYNTYKDKIGAAALRTNEAWAGFMTRSVKSKASMVNADSGAEYSKKIKYENNFMHICGSNGTDTVQLKTDGSLASQYQNSYYVRPVFWLNKDFFKNEKIEIQTAGKNIKELVGKEEYADLAELYSEEELESLGFSPENVPIAENVILTGLKAPGALLEVFYDYRNDYPEGGTEFEQYVINDEDAEPVAKSQSAKIDQAVIAGTFMKIAVIPKNINNISGKRAWSGMFEIKEPKAAAVSECNVVKNDSKVTAILTFTAEISEGSTAIVLYDKDNMMKKSEIYPIDTTVVTAKLEENITEGDVVRIIVKNKDGKVIYLKNIK